MVLIFEVNGNLDFRGNDGDYLEGGLQLKVTDAIRGFNFSKCRTWGSERVVSGPELGLVVFVSTTT